MKRAIFLFAPGSSMGRTSVKGKLMMVIKACYLSGSSMGRTSVKGRLMMVIEACYLSGSSL